MFGWLRVQSLQMNEGYRYDIAEMDLIPDDPQFMAQTVRQERARDSERGLLDYIDTCFCEAEDALPVGDLLDRVKAEHGDEKLAPSMELLWTMQARGEVILYEDNDQQRIVAQRLHPNQQA